jgi:hypothetical protein
MRKDNASPHPSEPRSAPVEALNPGGTPSAHDPMTDAMPTADTADSAVSPQTDPISGLEYQGTRRAVGPLQAGDMGCP